MFICASFPRRSLACIIILCQPAVWYCEKCLDSESQRSGCKRFHSTPKTVCSWVTQSSRSQLSHLCLATRPVVLPAPEMWRSSSCFFCRSPRPLLPLGNRWPLTLDRPGGGSSPLLFYLVVTGDLESLLWGRQLRTCWRGQTTWVCVGSTTSQLCGLGQVT